MYALLVLMKSVKSIIIANVENTGFKAMDILVQSYFKLGKDFLSSPTLVETLCMCACPPTDYRLD